MAGIVQICRWWSREQKSAKAVGIARWDRTMSGIVRKIAFRNRVGTGVAFESKVTCQ